MNRTTSEHGVCTGCRTPLNDEHDGHGIICELRRQRRLTKKTAKN